MRAYISVGHAVCILSTNSYKLCGTVTRTYLQIHVQNMSVSFCPWKIKMRFGQSFKSIEFTSTLRRFAIANLDPRYRQSSLAIAQIDLRIWSARQ